MPDAPRFQPLRHLIKHRAVHFKRQMVYTAGIGRRAVMHRLAIFIGKDRNQPPIAGIKVKVPFVRIIKIGLIKDERHPQHPLPKVDGTLPVCPGQGDVMHP